MLAKPNKCVARCQVARWDRRVRRHRCNAEPRDRM